MSDERVPAMPEIRAAATRLGLHGDAVWAAYAAVGGWASSLELEAWWYGALVPTAGDRTLLWHALWEVGLDRR